MSKAKSPIKYHGGKFYLAPKLVELMPDHLTYVEPYFGSGAVLFAKPFEGVNEIVNDLDYDLSLFWRVLQCPIMFRDFQRIVQAIPFSELEYESAQIPDSSSQVKMAVAFFVRCRQSLAGRMQDFAPLSTSRTRRGMNEQASAWLSAIDGLPEVHARLSRVAITSRDAIAVIEDYDGPHTFFYLDPPYHPSVRTATQVYKHEMNVEQHRALLDLLGGIKGKFMLSGYKCMAYDDAAAKYDWRCESFTLPNNAAGGKVKRKMVECVWMNY